MNRRELVLGGAALAFAGAVPKLAEARITPVTLDTARFELEHIYKVKAGLPGPWAQTGEKYVTICSGGIKPEGGPRLWCKSETEAIQKWLEVAISYSLLKMSTPYHYSAASTLYWRETPIIDAAAIEGTDDLFYSVYSRFLISNQPEIYGFREDYLPTRAG